VYERSTAVPRQNQAYGIRQWEKNSIGIKIEHGKPTKIILGLAGNHVTPIAPVTLHLDADDNIKFVELSHISIMLIDYNNQHFDAKKQIPATAN
jgi:hypothetical protein